MCYVIQWGASHITAIVSIPISAVKCKQSCGFTLHQCFQIIWGQSLKVIIHKVEGFNKKRKEKKKGEIWIKIEKGKARRRNKRRERKLKLWSVMLSLPATNTKDTRMPSELLNELSRFRLHTKGPLILNFNTCTGCHKECTIYHYIPLGPPVPVPPMTLCCVHSLRHLHHKRRLNYYFSYK